MSCNAGFRHEVMPLPFELQMLEVRPTCAGSLLGHPDLRANVLGATCLPHPCQVALCGRRQRETLQARRLDSKWTQWASQDSGNACFLKGLMLLKTLKTLSHGWRMQVALGAVCALCSQLVKELEAVAHPALDALTKHVRALAPGPCKLVAPGQTPGQRGWANHCNMQLGMEGIESAAAQPFWLTNRMFYLRRQAFRDRFVKMVPSYMY